MAGRIAVGDDARVVVAAELVRGFLDVGNGIARVVLALQRQGDGETKIGVRLDDENPGNHDFRPWTLKALYAFAARGQARQQVFDVGNVGGLGDVLDQGRRSPCVCPRAARSR